MIRGLLICMNNEIIYFVFINIFIYLFCVYLSTYKDGIPGGDEYGNYDNEDEGRI